MRERVGERRGGERREEAKVEEDKEEEEKECECSVQNPERAHASLPLRASRRDSRAVGGGMAPRLRSERARD